MEFKLKLNYAIIPKELVFLFDQLTYTSSRLTRQVIYGYFPLFFELVLESIFLKSELIACNSTIYVV
jgi:hypothetical protein